MQKNMLSAEAIARALRPLLWVVAAFCAPALHAQGTLSALTLTDAEENAISLSPGFSSSVTEYTATAYHPSTITLSASASSGTDITVNGKAVDSGAAYTVPDAELIPGQVNSIVIVATDAEDEGTTYTVALNLVDLVLTDISFSGAETHTLRADTFSRETYFYAVDIFLFTSGSGDSIFTDTAGSTFTPSFDDVYTVTVDGTPVESGDEVSFDASTRRASHTILVSRAGTAETRTYTLQVESRADRASDIMLSVGAFSPAFSIGTAVYTVSVPFDTTEMFITVISPVLNTPVELALPEHTFSGESGTPIALPLQPGSNIVRVFLTTTSIASDSDSFVSYTLTITRTDLTLDTLAFHDASTGGNALTFSPALADDVSEYTVTVSNSDLLSNLYVEATFTSGSAVIDDQPHTSGSTRTAVALDDATHSFDIVLSNTAGVDATGTTATETRTISVNVVQADAGLSDLVVTALDGEDEDAIMPDTDFTSATTSYTYSVPIGTEYVRVTPTVADEAATFSYTATGLPASFSSLLTADEAISLPVGLLGENVVLSIEVSRGDVSRTYQATLELEPVRITALTVPDTAVLSPAFDTDILNYNLLVHPDTTSIDLTPTFGSVDVRIGDDRATSTEAATIMLDTCDPERAAGTSCDQDIELVASGGDVSVTYTVSVRRITLRLTTNSGTIEELADDDTGFGDRVINEIDPDTDELRLRVTVVESDATIRMYNLHGGANRFFDTIVTSGTRVDVPLPVLVDTSGDPVDDDIVREFALDIERFGLVQRFDLRVERPRAVLTSISATTSGTALVLTPAFDPEVRRYTLSGQGESASSVSLTVRFTGESAASATALACAREMAEAEAGDPCLSSTTGAVTLTSGSLRPVFLEDTGTTVISVTISADEVAQTYNLTVTDTTVPFLESLTVTEPDDTALSFVDASGDALAFDGDMPSNVYRIILSGENSDLTSLIITPTLEAAAEEPVSTLKAVAPEGTVIMINDDVVADATAATVALDAGSRTEILITLTYEDVAVVYTLLVLRSDGASPTITRVQAEEDGTYGVGDRVEITVTFSEPVYHGSDHTAHPRIRLETGETDRYATYVSGGNGTDTVVLEYIVQAGDTSSDLGFSASSNVLAPDTSDITSVTLDYEDNEGNDLTRILPTGEMSLSGTSNVVIDTTFSARVTSVSGTSGTYYEGSSFSVQVVFNRVVESSDATPELALMLAVGTTTRAATYTGGLGTNTLSFTYTVQPGDEEADLNYVDSDSLAGTSTATLRLAGTFLFAMTALPATDSDMALAGTSDIAISITQLAAQNDRLIEIVLPRITQAIAASTVDAITERFDNTGKAATGSNFGHSLAHLLSSSTLNEGDLKGLLSRGHFVMPLSGDANRSGNLAVWMKGNITDLSGNDDGLKYEGDIGTLSFGFDGQATDRVLVGISLHWSDADFDYTDRGLDNSLPGQYLYEVTTVNPYVNWIASDRLSLWGMVGIGDGTIETKDASATAETDAEHVQLAGGLKIELVSGEAGRLHLKGDVIVSHVSVDASRYFSEADVETQRGRIILEASNTYDRGNGSVSPAIFAGFRYDGGDGDTGEGFEIGGKVAYRDTSERVSLEASGRYLLGGLTDEWGAGFLARVNLQNAGGTGFTLSLGPTVGDTRSQASRLWEQGAGQHGSSANDLKFVTELAYGFRLPTERRVALTPYARMNLKDERRSFELGQSLATGNFQLDMKISQDQHLGASAFLMEGRLHF